jgi:hypothetical protein
MWSEGIILFLKQPDFSFASSNERNQLTFKHSSRKLPLNDSMNGLSVGFLDLTHWANEQYATRKNVTITIPCRWTFARYPLDFVPVLTNHGQEKLLNVVGFRNHGNQNTDFRAIDANPQLRH